MPEILSTTDFDLPVTEEFLDRVQRGVRRRRAFRLTVASFAVLAVTGGVFAVARPFESALPPPPAATAGTSAVTAGFVAGFRITYVPDSVVLSREVGSITEFLTPDGKTATSGNPKSPDNLVVITSTRRFEQPNGGSYLWITVYTQQPEAAKQGSPILVNSMVNRHIDGTTPVERFDVPAGSARLTRTSGSETSSYGVVIATHDLSVIAIEANAQVSAEEIKAVAAGLIPA
jgi:hypothetical protein